MAENGAQAEELLTDSQKQSKYPPSRTAGLIPFRPGQSGNPGGNYKRTPKFNNTFERLLALSPAERKTYQPVNGVEELALAQINRAIAAEKERDRITATEKVIDRVEGKAIARKEVSKVSVNADLDVGDFIAFLGKLGENLDEERAAKLLELVASVEEME